MFATIIITQNVGKWNYFSSEQRLFFSFEGRLAITDITFKISFYDCKYSCDLQNQSLPDNKPLQ